MSDIKAGYHVRVIDKGPNQYLTNGKVYMVLDVNMGDIRVINDNGRVGSYLAHRFEIVDAVPEPEPTSAAASDIVSIDVAAEAIEEVLSIYVREDLGISADVAGIFLNLDGTYELVLA